MLKRFYSKKSGFTLVEIIIAFAIFSIMAAMICQILDLSVSARRSNNVYQRELAEQEALLTLIEKTNKDYTGTVGEMKITLNGKEYSIPYDMLSAKADAEFAGEGLNYYLANVNYQSSGEIAPGDSEGDASGGTNTGSQASRMDTRITGTAGIGFINIIQVIKDENDYAPGDPYAVPAGHTRYFIRCSASSKTDEDTPKETLKDEDAPYAQYRLFFYDSNRKNTSESSKVYTDKNGKKYTKDVFEPAVITKVGYLNDYASNVASVGLNSSNAGTRVSENYNKYAVEQMASTNCIRIGTQIPKEWGGFEYKKFEGSNSNNFYIEFEGDPLITTESFGYNAKAASNGHNYTAFPMYPDEYDEDGNPVYGVATDYKTHVNIYGASLFTRHYVDDSETPSETPETPDPDPEEGGDSE